MLTKGYVCATDTLMTLVPFDRLLIHGSDDLLLLLPGTSFPFLQGLLALGVGSLVNIYNRTP